MTRFTVFFLSLWIWGAVSLPAAPKKLPLPLADNLTPAQLSSYILARAALLYDPATRTILFQRSIDTPYPPASTIKLLTALVVYENKGMNGIVRVDAGDTQVEPSHVPLIAGESVPVSDLMHALLIASDNDSALALAHYTGGSVDNFINMMNLRARQLGCPNTFCVNPHGLPAQGMVTTARDLLRIFQHVIAIPSLRRICQTKQFELQTARGTQILHNHNRLLGKYPGMGPAKTGWTLAARNTYAAACIREGRELHLVLLSSADKWRDARMLFDYGFAHLPELPTEQARLSSDPNAAPPGI